MQIVDLAKLRSERERPDTDLISRDDFGREMRTFQLEYEMAGSEWGLTITAYDMEDALGRAEAIRKSLIVVGELHSKVPA